MLRKRFFIAAIPLFILATANAQIRPAASPAPPNPPTKANPSQASPQPNTPGSLMPPATNNTQQPGTPATPPARTGVSGLPINGNPTPTGVSGLPTTGNPAPTGVSGLPATGNPTQTTTGPLGQPAIQLSPSGPLQMSPAPRSFGSPATRQTLTTPQGSISNSYPFSQYSLSNGISLQPRRLQIGQNNPLNISNAQPQGILSTNTQLLQVNGLFTPSSLGFANGQTFIPSTTLSPSLPTQQFMTDWANSTGFGRFDNRAALFAQQQLALQAQQANGANTAIVPQTNNVPNPVATQPTANAPAATQPPTSPVAPTQFPTQSAGGVGPVPRQ